MRYVLESILNLWSMICSIQGAKGVPTPQAFQAQQVILSNDHTREH